MKFAFNLNDNDNENNNDNDNDNAVKLMPDILWALAALV